jgi:mono/diheme cytochrome c family protein
MRKLLPPLTVLALVTLVGLMARAPGANARPSGQFIDPVRQGEYLATIAGCIDCHSPLGPDGRPDLTRKMAGGQEFLLGPLGVAISKNLTPDPETGIGSWTDDELKTAIRIGISPDGLHAFPIMPYVLFSNMAESDLDALVAYMRSLPAIVNAVPRPQVVPAETLPQLPERRGLTAPDPADTAARGVYLLTAVIGCTDCHTPLDETTGQPIMEKYLAGGQPYEGPWGIVYGANITPDPETGIGNWSDNDLQVLLRAGIRPDGRRVVLMPWQAFSALTTDDAEAVIHYLRNNVPAVSNDVPAPALNEGFLEFVEVEAPGQAGLDLTWVVGGVVAAVLVIGGALLLMRRPKSPPPAA